MNKQMAGCGPARIFGADTDKSSLESSCWAQDAGPGAGSVGKWRRYRWAGDVAAVHQAKGLSRMADAGKHHDKPKKPAVPKCRRCHGSGIDPETQYRYTSGGRDDRSCKQCHGTGEKS
jgi:Cytochrome c554 and c-prime